MNKKRLTFIVLATFLILSGLAGLITGIGGLGIIIAILALAAGVLLLLFTPGISYSVGWMLAAVYLIARGLISIINFGFSGINTIMAILALVAGILLLIKLPGIKNNVGVLLFAVWMVLVGLIALISLGKLSIIVPIAAVASGVLLLLGN